MSACTLVVFTTRSRFAAEARTVFRRASMKKLGAILLGIVAVTAAFAAVTVHYFTAVCQNDNLVTTFKVSGLGNVPSVSFRVLADADVEVTMVNKGGNRPPGLVRTTSARNIGGTFPVRNGQTTGMLTITKAQAAEFQYLAPKGMAATEVNVLAYRNIRLIDASGRVLTTIPYVKC